MRLMIMLSLMLMLCGSPPASAVPVKTAAAWRPAVKELLIPFNEERALVLKGTVRGAPLFEDYDENLISVRYDAAAKAVRIKGLEPGSTVLKIIAGKTEHSVSVSVKRYAGSLPGKVSVTITGKDISPEIITEAVESSLSLRSETENDSVIRFTLKEMPELKEDSACTFSAAASITGPGLITVTREIPVTLTVGRIDIAEPGALIVSNHPERITREGILLDEKLPEKGNCRFLLHHSNSPGASARRLVTKLTNQGSSESQIHIIHHCVGPSSDEIYAGHMAASLLWKDWLKGQGYILTIPAGRTCILDNVVIKPGHLVSGMSNFITLEGPAPRIIVEALGGEDEPAGSYLHGATSKGIFLSPAIHIEKTHSIGSAYTFIYLGGKPYLKEQSTGQDDIGNYGVIYTIDITIQNPLEEENDVSVCFTPGGGPARGIFLIDNALFETPMAVHLQDIVLHKSTLAPGEQKTLRLVTFPQSGSNYPVRIVVKSKLVKE